MMPPQLRRPRRLSRARPAAAVLSGVLTFAMLALLAAAVAPPPPPGWKPAAALRPDAPPGPFTGWQLARATARPEACRAALARAEGLTAPPVSAPQAPPACRIATPVTLSQAAGAGLAAVTADCGVALRLHMWQRHGLNEAARRHLGAPVAEIRHLGAHACRPVRGGTRMSAHATGRAIDVAGVALSDGRRVSVAEGGAFWRDARRAACRWFPTVLGPGFDAAHAGHLHLAEGRWRACR